MAHHVSRHFVADLHLIYHRKYLLGKPIQIPAQMTWALPRHDSLSAVRIGGTCVPLAYLLHPVRQSGEPKVLAHHAHSRRLPRRYGKEFRCVDRMWLRQRSASRPGSWQGHYSWAKALLSLPRTRPQLRPRSAQWRLKHPRSPRPRRLAVRMPRRPCHPPGLDLLSRPEVAGRLRSALWSEPASRPFSRCGSDSDEGDGYWVIAEFLVRRLR